MKTHRLAMSKPRPPRRSRDIALLIARYLEGFFLRMAPADFTLFKPCLVHYPFARRDRTQKLGTADVGLVGLRRRSAHYMCHLFCVLGLHFPSMTISHKGIQTTRGGMCGCECFEVGSRFRRALSKGERVRTTGDAKQVTRTTLTAQPHVTRSAVRAENS